MLKHEERKQLKLDKYIDEYTMCSEMIRARKKVIFSTFVLNILQRLSILAVPFFIFLATGGGLAKAAEVLAVQSYVVIGSNAIPIPGAMGVSDYIMLDGFGKLMPYQNAVNFELLSRSLSFYVCVILCGAAVILKYFIKKRTDKKK